MRPIVSLTQRMALRFLRLAAMLVLLFVFAVGLILFNPHWLLGLVKKTLSEQGINANISDLRVNFSGTSYQLTGLVKAQTDKGITLHQAQITTTVDWSLLWQRQPFIVKTKVSQLSAEIDRILLLEQWRKKTVSRQKTPFFLPLSWQLEPAQIVVDGHHLTLAATGEKDQQFQATLSDESSGKIQLYYSQPQQQLSLESQQMNLLALTGHQAVLHNIKATINPQNWLNSELVTRLTYQNISSEISIKQQGNQIDIAAKSASGQSAHVKLKVGKKQSIAYFEQLDLSLYNLLRPLIPAQFGLSSLSGKLTGQVAFNQRQIVAGQGQIKNLTLTHQHAKADRINAYFKFTERDIHYQLDLNNSQVSLPNVFEQSISQLQGQIAGQLDLSEQKLSIKHLNLSGQEFEQVTAQGHFIWPTHRQKLFIEMSGQLTNVTVARIKHFLPHQLPEKTKSWLGNALLSGKINQTRFFIQGNPEAYSTGGLDLQVKTHFEQTGFRFLPDHPVIDFQSGQLSLAQRTLQVNTSQATINHLPFTAKAKIKDLLKAVVNLEAEIKKQAAEKLLITAKKTIAKQSLKQIEKHLKIQGQFDLSLVLSLILHDATATDRFTLKLASDKATAVLLDYPELSLKRAKATVSLNTDGLQQLRATGLLQGSPAEIAVDTQKSGYTVKIKNTGNLPNTLTHLQLLPNRLFQWLIEAEAVTGQSDFITTLALDQTGTLHTVAVQSDLSGTQLNLLSALKKPKKTPLTTRLNYNHQQRFFSLQLGQAKLQAGLTEKGKIKGLLLSNLAKKPSYQADKIQLYWQAKEFDYALFEHLHHEVFPLSANHQEQLPVTLNLHFDSVYFANGKTYPFSLWGKSTDLHLDSPILSGFFEFKGGHLQADIQKAHLDKLLQLNDKKTTNPAGRPVTKMGLTKALPTLTLRVEQLYFKDNIIGDASLKTSEDQKHYSIDQLLVNGQHFYIEASGYEKTEPQGLTTHFQADFKGEDLLAVIKSLGLNEMIDAKSLDLSLKLSWPGKAHTLNLQQSYGQGKISALNLKMLNIDAGVGGVFGLMDITQILKRITLDFKNITTSKIAFDELSGNWNIGGGRAVTRDFHAQGSVIAIKLSGPIDLYRHEFDDLEMTVIPKTSNVLPVIGAVTGGVVGSAIGLAVKQLLGKQIDGMIGLPYIISGSWVNPQLDFGQPSMAKDQPETQLDSNHPGAANINIDLEALNATTTKQQQSEADRTPQQQSLSQDNKSWTPAPDWQPIPQLNLESLK